MAGGGELIAAITATIAVHSCSDKAVRRWLIRSVEEVDMSANPTGVAVAIGVEMNAHYRRKS